MSLAAGTKLGAYVVAESIGAGGMGEVYRATDTSLKRDVAVKVLPAEFETDAIRLARFQREAEALAALNHVNIAQIYGLEKSAGVAALVMELVDGPTLAERLAGGPMPVSEALDIAKQVAAALEAAHERGIVHRDLKPANIKLRPDGTVKVLDFGLAKTIEPSSSTGDTPMISSPTVTTAGQVLGTAAYMSPEQARGKSVDKRSDIWAFGAVVFEMLTGQRAFSGEDVTDTLAAILRSEPQWGELPVGVSPVVETYLRRCLRKEPRERIQDIGDMRLALEGAFDIGAAPSVESGAAQSWRRPVFWVPLAAALGLAAIAVAGWLSPAPRDTTGPVSRFAITPPAEAQIAGVVVSPGQLVISPDGKRIAYAAMSGGLAVRTLDDLAIDVKGNAVVANAVFSPDGEWVAYMDKALIRVPMSGQGGIEVTKDLGRNWRGASWGADGSILFADNRGLLRVAADGGDPEILISPNRDDNEFAYASPQLLPDGHSILFTILAAASIEGAQLAVLDTNTMTYRKLGPTGASARYVDTGHVVYATSDELQAQRFDLARLAVVGEPVTVIDEPILRPREGTTATFDVSSTGTLVYRPADVEAQGNILIWVDRDGREEPLPVPRLNYIYPRISPDGTMVALDVGGTTRDIYVIDLTRNDVSRLTTNPAEDFVPAWNHAGDEVLFASGRDAPAPARIFAQRPDGASEPRRIYASDVVQMPYFELPDGSGYVVNNQGPETFFDIALLTLDEPPRVEPLVATTAIEINAVLSRDERWFAYQSNESGQFEVYVRPFPEADRQRTKVSPNGGTRPLWSPDGTELFYRGLEGVLYSVPVTFGENISIGTPVKLLDPIRAGAVWAAVGGRDYDVSPIDGRFLMTKPASDDFGQNQRIVVVQNWFSEIERLAPSE